MEQRKRRRQSADAWRAMLVRQAESGQTVAAFCEREGIKPASLYQWRSKLSSASEQTKSSASPASEPTPPAGFVDLGTLTAGGSRFELRLELGGGVTVHLARG